MQYEYLFWSMAALVAAALAVGSLCGRMASAGRTFAGVAVWASRCWRASRCSPPGAASATWRACWQSPRPCSRW
ncbi:hypothetical protein [Achromobacter sp. DMS1]|uniref:hypothetical protein n=1 Tax=Achromobacter sp. DMS1 TaxID=1688405 RepID=UPI000A5FB18A|nr:hypothetical protein [Achromobacter sp. DMS1]